MIHSLQLAHRALWSNPSRIPTTGAVLGVVRPWLALWPRDGLCPPRTLLRSAGAYTVSASIVGELERDEGAAATVDESCWNHRSRARRLTTSTSFDAKGTGIWVSLSSDPTKLTFIIMWSGVWPDSPPVAPMPSHCIHRSLWSAGVA
jgi:hypothetical protein